MVAGLNRFNALMKDPFPPFIRAMARPARLYHGINEKPLRGRA
jgi:hypothetical protein